MGRYFAKKMGSVQILIYSNKLTTFKMFSILAISALLAAASADTVGYLPAPAPAPYLAPQPYAFTYGVSDSYSGSEYAAQAADDGKVVTGSYSVHLPDGRIQTVTYTADHVTGYHADVTYSGAAKYPEYVPNYPLYKPKFVYKPLNEVLAAYGHAV